MLAIETIGLEKRYRGKVHALKGVDLRVPEGAAFGLLGPNGAGKSTLVKALLSIVHLTGGSAKILGRDVASPEARVGVGYLPEGHRFPRYLTGRGVCRYFGKLSRIDKDALERDIDEKLALVGMTEWADTKISKYSKGMAQRIGLAQAMLGNPQLLFLDEPTDGVDPVGRQQIRSVITQLRDTGATVFINSHLLLEVEQICDHVAILHKGAIIEQGTLDEVRKLVGSKDGLHQVTFRTGTLSQDALNELATLGTVSPFEGGVQLVLGDREQISVAIDQLRRHQVAIYAVEPGQANLEEVFMQLIGEQAEQGPGATRS